MTWSARDKIYSVENGIETPSVSFLGCYLSKDHPNLWLSVES